ncbi:MAG: YHYH protein [Planctomycetes bacterium]|nr:YHYH protein [Planctomycetota bacterium]
MRIPSRIAVFSALFVSASSLAMPYGIGCATDVNVDGAVGVGDVLTIIDSWGTSDENADCNGDGIVSVGDLLMLIDEWGTDCESIHPFVDNTVVTFDYDQEHVVVFATGIPNHPTGPFDGSTGCWNPNTVTAQNRTYRIPMNPVDTNNPSVVVFNQWGPISVTVNGVPFYNPYDNGGNDAPSTICFDEYNGHPQLMGEYHYHQWSPALDAMETDGHSGVVGYSFDGYPIFGPYESEGIDAHSDLGNPLDDCHGHSDPIRGYHYHTSLPYSEDPNGFPWVLGCYSAEPEMSNFALPLAPPSR